MEAREKLETYQTIPHVISLNQMKDLKIFVFIKKGFLEKVQETLRHLWKIVKTKTIKKLKKRIENG